MQRQIPLLPIRLRAQLALMRLNPQMHINVLVQMRRLPVLLIAHIARIQPLPRMNILMNLQPHLLPELLVANVALERLLLRVYQQVLPKVVDVFKRAIAR